MWLVLIGVALVLALIFFFNSYQNKYQNLQGNLFNFLVMLSLIFLILTLGGAYLASDFNLLSFEGIVGFFKFYMVWLGNFFSKGVSVAGYLVRQEWSLNATNFTG